MARSTQDEGAALERLGHAQKAFDLLKTLAPSVEPLAQELSEAKARLMDDIAHQLKSLAERWEADPAALEASLGRLDLLSRLKKKYGGTLDAVIARGLNICAEDLGRLENADAYRKELENQTQKARAALDDACRDLSQKRRKSAKELGTAAQKELADLGLKSAIFRCQVDALPEPSSTRDGCGRFRMGAESGRRHPAAQSHRLRRRDVARDARAQIRAGGRRRRADLGVR